MSDFIFSENFPLGQNPTRQFYERFMKDYVHKLNNLAGVVQGFSDILLQDLATASDDIISQVKLVNDTARSMAKLNSIALDATVGKRIEPANVSLDQSLPYWRSKSEEICATHGIPVTLEVRSALPNAAVDTGRLAEIYFPLLVNAAESAADFSQSAVAVDLFPPGATSSSGCIDIYIQNRSVQFTEEQLRSCFIPFVSSKSSEHFGLGLSSAALAANDLGMRIGLRWKDEMMMTWLSVPVASA